MCLLEYESKTARFIARMLPALINWLCYIHFGVACIVAWLTFTLIKWRHEQPSLQLSERTIDVITRVDSVEPECKQIVDAIVAAPDVSSELEVRLVYG